MVAVVKAQKPKQITAAGASPSPTAKQMPDVTAAALRGQRNWYRRCEAVARRQAMSGPTPVRKSSTSPIGTIHLLKKGGPTVIRSPVTASDRVGNMVAKRTKKAANSKIQLFTVKAASRDSHESRVARERSSGIRLITNPKLTISVMAMKMVKIHASFVS